MTRETFVKCTRAITAHYEGAICYVFRNMIELTSISVASPTRNPVRDPFIIFLPRNIVATAIIVVNIMIASVKERNVSLT